jgi:hypothetical protein
MRCLAIALVAFALLGCGPDSQRDPNLGPEADYSRYEAFADEIRGASKPVLYEGLPSDFDEGELLKSELEKGIHLELEGETFYKETMELSDADAERLTGLLSGNDVAIEYGGEKTCGPFHADYGLEWNVKGKKMLAMVCFSCHEIIAVGPEGQAITDISDWGYKELQQVLRKYRKNRPQTFSGELLELFGSFREAGSVSVHIRKTGEGEEVGRTEMSPSVGNLTDADRLQIAKVLVDSGSFGKHTPKKCRFNADYGLKWKNLDETDAILLCFTCSEIKIYRGDYESHYDLKKSAKETLERLLLAYKPQN